ncbi:MAG: hypothetical protein HC868_05310 [Sphingomonadales bacterium]|nr:hypothetical protein [Sphingomonadales bacterium]
MRRLRMTALGRLKNDQRGAALLLFTVFLVPLLAVVAVGIDLSRFLLVKQRLINAADAAALAVGTRPNLTADEATAMAGAFIRAHYRDESLSHLESFSVTPTNNQVDVTVHARLETTFLKVLNVATLDVRVSTQVAPCTTQARGGAGTRQHRIHVSAELRGQVRQAQNGS